MHVGLVSGVEDEDVARRVEDAVQGDRQFDDTEVGPQVAARAGDGGDEVAPDLAGEVHQLRGREVPEVVRLLHTGEQGQLVGTVGEDHGDDSSGPCSRPTSGAPGEHRNGL